MICLALAVPLLLVVLGCGGSTTSTKPTEPINHKDHPADSDKSKPPKGDPG
jgi:hypothetical protein